MYTARQMEILIAKRDKRIRALQERVVALEAELEKWTSQQRKGRRPNPKIQPMHEDVRAMNADGVSNREIARRFGISEGTVRSVLKNSRPLPL